MRHDDNQVTSVRSTRIWLINVIVSLTAIAVAIGLPSCASDASMTTAPARSPAPDTRAPTTTSTADAQPLVTLFPLDLGPVGQVGPGNKGVSLVLDATGPIGLCVPEAVDARLGDVPGQVQRRSPQARFHDMASSYIWSRETASGTLSWTAEFPGGYLWPGRLDSISISINRPNANPQDPPLLDSIVRQVSTATSFTPDVVELRHADTNMPLRFVRKAMLLKSASTCILVWESRTPTESWVYLTLYPASFDRAHGGFRVLERPSPDHAP